MPLRRHRRGRGKWRPLPSLHSFPGPARNGRQGGACLTSPTPAAPGPRSLVTRETQPLEFAPTVFQAPSHWLTTRGGHEIHSPVRCLLGSKQMLIRIRTNSCVRSCATTTPTIPCSSHNADCPPSWHVWELNSGYYIRPETLIRSLENWRVWPMHLDAVI